MIAVWSMEIRGWNPRSKLFEIKTLLGVFRVEKKEKN